MCCGSTYDLKEPSSLVGAVGIACVRRTLPVMAAITPSAVMRPVTLAGPTGRTTQDVCALSGLIAPFLRSLPAAPRSVFGHAIFLAGRPLRKTQER
jgi:hypothetical protein